MKQTCAPPATKAEAHRAPHTTGPEYQTTHSDYPAAEPFRKRFSRLQAEYAMAGYELHELQAGTLIVSRWALHKVLADMEAAEKMLEQIGGRHG